MTPVLSCLQVSVERGHSRVIDSLDLELGDGETLAVLGPSGSGKSTLMFAIAGFVDVSGGVVQIDGASVSTSQSTVPPERRNVGVVFQNYALWPHLTALETVAYPLRRAGLGRAASERRAAELLETVGIGSLGARKPGELSGGEQQRVGLARALARDARLYLFDEPTAHLDAPIRASVQEEIGRRRLEEGAAAVYATHDAGEALALADRVALLRDGRIVQVGLPAEVYERPVDRWAARLTGPVSTLEVDVKGVTEGRASVSVGADRITAAVAGSPRGRMVMLVRPEWVRFGGSNPGRIDEVWFRGPHSDYRLSTAAGVIDARVLGPPIAGRGESVQWSIDRGWIPAGQVESEAGAAVTREGDSRSS